MTKHTPGPWEAVEIEQCGGIGFVRIGEDQIGGMRSSWDGSCDTLSLADARLIAAAPELLVALRECLAYLEDDLPEPRYTNAVRAANAAIKKATGEGA